ncbi:MAG: zinc ABC transporter substrate-binding protein [Planctomycetota bacterium]
MRVWIGVLLFLGACGDEVSDESANRLRERPLVLTTNYPLQYCVERIVGGLGDVQCVVPTGEDPLHWHPSRGDVSRMQGADLVVLNGASAEPWVFQASLPLSRLVDTSSDFSARFLEREGAVTHSHGGGEAHTHAATDPHTWLDPRQLEEQAGIALSALIRRLPGREPQLRENYGALAEDLREIDRLLLDLERRTSGEAVAAPDDVYGYLFRRTGWTMVDLNIDPEAPASDAMLASVRELLSQSGVRVVLWPSVPDEAIVERLEREFSVRSESFPLLVAAPGSSGADFLSEMRQNLERLAQAFAD